MAGCASSQSASVPCGFAERKLLPRPVDQRAGFAVHAHHRVRPERGDFLETVEQDVIRDRLYDPRHARHVELERTDTELLGVTGNFLDLLLGEDLRMKDGVDVAALVHRLLERRKVIEIRILEAAQENSDRRDTAEDRGARFGLRFAFVGLLVADVGVGVEDARQNGPPGRVVGLGRRLREVFAERNDLAVSNSDVSLDLPNTRNDERAAADQQIKHFRTTGVLVHGYAPCLARRPCRR